MGSEEESEDREVDIMAATTVEYNEKVFLSELESSLKEMQEKKKAMNGNLPKSSWRDLFTMDEE